MATELRLNASRSDASYDKHFQSKAKKENVERVGESGKINSKDLRQLRESIAAVRERFDFIDSQIDNIECATPELERKIHYARIGQPLTSLSVEGLLQLKRIHDKLLLFWEDMNKKQLEKLATLSACLEELENQRVPGTVKPENHDIKEVKGDHNKSVPLSKDRKNQQEWKDRHVEFCFEQISVTRCLGSQIETGHVTKLRERSQIETEQDRL